jgi:hypothetical protein
LAGSSNKSYLIRASLSACGLLLGSLSPTLAYTATNPAVTNLCPKTVLAQANVQLTPARPNFHLNINATPGNSSDDFYELCSNKTFTANCLKINNLTPDPTGLTGLVIIGSGTSDTIIGSPGPDIICGMNGNYDIHGENGR